MRKTASIDRHVFNRRIRPQALERLRSARIAELDRARQHAIGNFAPEPERESRALGERGGPIGAVGQLGDGRAGAVLAQLDDDCQRLAGVSRTRVSWATGLCSSAATAAGDFAMPIESRSKTINEVLVTWRFLWPRRGFCNFVVIEGRKGSRE